MIKRSKPQNDYSLFTINPTDGNVVSEIFQNNFDPTWHHQDRQNKTANKEWTILPGEHFEDDGSVTYRYNNEYFRCDDFKNSHEGLHILFAGCSETEGMGGQLEDSWGKILLEKIAATNDVDGFYSVAKAGFGWQKVITQTQTYIKKYGKPDILFVLLPNIGRFIKWSNKKNDWMYQQAYPNFEQINVFNSTKDSNIDEDLIPKSMTPEEYKEMFINFVISWRLFEDFCEAAGIELVWATWDTIDNNNIDSLKDFRIFKNFIPIYKYRFEQQLFSTSIKLKKHDLEKRDGHHGRLFHEYWADEFIKESKNRGILK